METHPIPGTAATDDITRRSFIKKSSFGAVVTANTALLIGLVNADTSSACNSKCEPEYPNLINPQVVDNTNNIQWWLDDTAGVSTVSFTVQACGTAHQNKVCRVMGLLKGKVNGGPIQTIDSNIIFEPGHNCPPTANAGNKTVATTTFEFAKTYTKLPGNTYSDLTVEFYCGGWHTPTPPP